MLRPTINVRSGGTSRTICQVTPEAHPDNTHFVLKVMRLTFHSTRVTRMAILLVHLLDRHRHRTPFTHRNRRRSRLVRCKHLPLAVTRTPILFLGIVNPWQDGKLQLSAQGIIHLRAPLQTFNILHRNLHLLEQLAFLRLQVSRKEKVRGKVSREGGTRTLVCCRMPAAITRLC